MNDERESQPRQLSALAQAVRSTNVCVELRVEDVLAVRPEWTEQKAKQFLSRHSSALAAGMLAAGTALIERFITLTERNS